MDKVKNLIDMIVSGKTENFEQSFNDLMQERVTNRVAELRVDIARGMFKESVEDEIEGLEAIVEAYESLDEISKATLGSYIKKATDDKNNQANKSWKHQDAADFALLVNKDKHTANKHLDLSTKSSDKFYKRVHGIAKATDKLTKEDFEALQAYIAEEDQIIEDILALDEISKDTLSSYIKKASRSAVNKAENLGVKIGRELEATGHVRKAPWPGKAEKRLRGIAKATDRLTKEQKEQISSILEELESEIE